MAKTVNYTPEAVELMTGMYNGVREESEERRDEVVAEIAAILEKDVRSVRAKLARLEIYIPKVVKSKVTGEAAAKKIDMAEQLIAISGVNRDKVDAERVAKMNKIEIAEFIKAFKSLAESVNPETTEEDESES